jgi:hypothetical protein
MGHGRRCFFITARLLD